MLPVWLLKFAIRGLSLLWKAFKPLLFLMDAEKVHLQTVRVLRFLFRPYKRTGRTLITSAAPSEPASDQSAGTEVWGIRFRSPIGLAAGFDKNAELLPLLPAFGFGFAEIGTVTPRPQAGNERPRLFRDPARHALFNRMGFNNDGAQIIAARVLNARERLPSGFPVGVNVGKNKDTSLDSAASDYAAALRPFNGAVDYAVVNVSSPNTPGLRSLQTLAALEPIISEAQSELQRWKKPVPLLLKLAPELSEEEFLSIFEKTPSWGIKGWVLTNTLGGTFDGRAGGWSGLPLVESARNALKISKSHSSLPVISVGGILSKEEAQVRFESGADLVQIYTGWIYNGPEFPAKLARFCSKRKLKP